MNPNSYNNDHLQKAEASLDLVKSEMKSSSMSSSPVLSASSKVSPPESILKAAAGAALKGGFAGAAAQAFNVFCFMGLRTTMNYQYRYGGTMRNSIITLWKEGGIMRFYRGIIPALMQSPLSRFGDTAANVGVLHALDSSSYTSMLPLGFKSALASCGASCFRLFLMPIDAWKTIKQVEGKDGLKALRHKVRVHGFSKLYHGSCASMSATLVGHYPWFFVHNYLSQNLVTFDFQYGKYVRNGFIGFVASIVSDTCSNSIRVVKTTKQTSVTPMTYSEAVRDVVSKDGLSGLFGRGLTTRIFANGLQGMVFSIFWKAIQELITKQK